MACLIKGVYIAQIDRQENRREDKQIAPTWWEAFHFKCIKVLEDDVDSSIFGAVFEYMGHQIESPKYVIAIRGTMINSRTAIRDVYMDAKIALNELSHSSRCELALKAVEGMIGSTHHTNVWLAGHSLGASIALQTGRDMAKRGYYLETYLFNPPFLRLPLEKIKCRKIKNGIRFMLVVLHASK
ncbi:GDSL esterase/lipase At4g10955-like [Beta vulgaris subsp. vulgaris]|uniref:GDSL esterase/lipase At4g10955-like n=1 Tax=Beta vulgaris subsp. vulgaris TaxID=3555 RepID=UPI00053FCC99|nr:GDSL esterase/lipase At4g10955-like [Beta vulgaris subsp. vulgaris]